MRIQTTAMALAALLLLSTAGCGYQFGTTVRSTSARGLHLAVPVFLNDTFEPVLDKRVTEFVRRQFLQADGITLVNDAGSASTVLKGRIRGYGLQTLSFRQGSVNEQRVVVSVDVRYEDSAKKVLWQESFSTSAEFFQTTDLAVNRSRQDRATEEACQALAENIVSRVLEGYDAVDTK
jgi:outer membrane lipopolysaccharide assembly protein LptE/RlpB